MIGEFRDKKGHYYGFIPDTIRAFTKCGMKYYNEIKVDIPAKIK